MAVDYIITGEAIGGNYDTKGDRKQTSVPDYDGEVRLIKRSVSSFFNYMDTTKNRHYKVYRPIDINEARVIAELAIRAANNPNIGYSQNYDKSDPDVNRSAIFKHGADSQVPINCDCSSLGSYCVSMATGINIGACSSSSIGSAIAGTGHFFPVFQSTVLNKDNLPYNGDVFVRSKSDTPAGGHVFMIVSGHPREGAEDEIVSSTGVYASAGGVTSDVISYRSQYGQTYTFSPRTTEPEPTNPYYDVQCGVTANGAYAWGRFSEICRSTCDLSRMEPRRWYTYKEDGYQREVAPSLGAVMCFTHIYDQDDPGYVCIVEKVDKDKMDVSTVSLTTEKFEYKTIEKRNGSWDMDLDSDGKYEYMFQGFICNPGVDIHGESKSVKDQFIEIAKAQSGTDGSFTEAQTGVVTVSAAWSAAFINAVAKKTGSLLNIIIPNTLSCSDIGRIGVLRGMGIWLDGPSMGKFPEPRVGDIALFRTSSNSDNSNRYAADKAGIIIEVGQASSTAQGTNEGTSYSFTVVMGDCNKKVKTKTYTTSSGSFSGIYRPYWQQVDGTTGSIHRYTNIEGLYTEGTSLEDAAIRDLRYVTLSDIGFEPSINPTGLKLCAINYTGMLANLYSTFAEVSSSSATNADLVVDLWNNSVKSVFQDDSYETAPFVGASAGSDTADGTYTVDGTVINPGGSVDATSIFQSEFGELITSAIQNVTSRTSLSGWIGTTLEVTATYNELRITKRITLTNTVKAIYDLLYAELGNPSAAIGIMANMFQESEFILDSINTLTGGCGLIHWTGKRASDMKIYCKQHSEFTEWTENLGGQVGFIFNEAVLNSTFKAGMDSIRKVPYNIEGAIRATRLFLDYFILGGPSHQGELREVEQYNIRTGWAKGLWNLVFGGMLQK